MDASTKKANKGVGGVILVSVLAAILTAWSAGLPFSEAAWVKDIAHALGATALGWVMAGAGLLGALTGYVLGGALGEAQIADDDDAMRRAAQAAAGQIGALAGAAVGMAIPSCGSSLPLPWLAMLPAGLIGIVAGVRFGGLLSAYSVRLVRRLTRKTEAALVDLAGAVGRRLGPATAMTQEIEGRIVTLDACRARLGRAQEPEPEVVTRAREETLAKLDRERLVLERALRERRELVRRLREAEVRLALMSSVSGLLLVAGGTPLSSFLTQQRNEALLLLEKRDRHLESGEVL